MGSVMLVIAVTAFLSGAAAAVFLMLVIGIRKADRRRGLPVAPNTPVDAVTRTILRGGTWPNSPVIHGDPKDH